MSIFSPFSGRCLGYLCGLSLGMSVAFGEVAFSGLSGPPAAPLSLWYRQPAVDWSTEALPIGNGRFGAMVFGGVASDRVQFNDKTVWTGSKSSRGSYQNFGDIYLEFAGLSAVSNYRRELSLSEGIARVTYNVGGTTFTREYFSSYPDGVTVIRLTSSGSGNLNFTVRLVDAHPGTMTAAEGTITMAGALTLLSYEAQVSVLNEGGSLSTTGNQITVSNANAVTIVLAGTTDYSPTSSTYVNGGGAAGVHTAVSNAVAAAAAKAYETLKARHLADYRALFDRVSLNLNHGEPSIPTNELLANFKAGKFDPALEALYFQLGRFFAIASSRGLALPSNLQGIWNNRNDPAWQSDIHTNINVEMNYWLAQITNLGECHAGFNDWIYNEAMTQPSWRGMAASLGASGWTIRTQNNIFGYSDWEWDRPANAWFCMSLWQQYTHTLDRTFLANRAYPVMKSACDFWLSRLVTASDGTLVAPNEWSPEQGNPREDGTAYAQQLIWDLFTTTIEASTALNVDPTYRATLQTALAKLDPGTRIGPWGELREWRTAPDVQGDTHRHISPLIALYPGKQISPLIDPAMANAAKVLLTSRGDGSFGWSCVWRAACWARLFDGNKASLILRKNLLGTANTQANLFDIYPPFQIDANFGGSAVMAEMLLQSHLDMLQLLPALPDVWDSGSVTGLVAKGAFVVDLNWCAKALVRATITAKVGGPCVVKNPVFAGSFTLKDSAGASVPFTASGDTITFNTTAGGSYVITGPAPAAPGVPGGLTAIGGDMRVMLSWTAVSGATSYQVWRSNTSGSGYVTVANVAGGFPGYVDTGLANGTTYYYVVIASNSSGASAASLPANATPLGPPPVPTGLVATNGQNSQTTLTWTASPGAASYRVKRSTTNGAGYATVASPTGTTSTNAGLRNGTTYYYVVTAVNTVGESGASTQVSVTPAGLPPVPDGLTAAGSNRRVTVSWNAVPGATGYRMKRSTTSGSGYASVALPSNVTYADDTVTNDTKYFYVVTAISGYGEGGNSVEVSATPSAFRNRATGGTATASTAASPNETAAKVFDGLVTTKWYNTGTAPPGWLQYDFGPATKWAITRYDLTSGNDVPGRDPAAWQLLGSQNGTDWTVLDSRSNQTFPATPRNQTKSFSLTNATAYRYYRLSITASFGGTAANAGLQLSEFALFAADLVGVPTGLTASGGGAQQMNLAWNGVGDAATYIVRRSAASGGPYTTIASNVTGTSYVDPVAGGTYFYVVAAVNELATGVDSVEASATVIPAVPTGLSAMAGDSLVTLNWNATPGAASYRLKRSANGGGGYVILASPATPGYSDATVANGTAYSYVVTTVAGGAESGDSGVVSATPVGASQLIAPKITQAGDLLNFGVRSVVGRSYQLQRSTTMAPGSWVDLGNAQAGTGNELTFTDPFDPQAPRRFYRVRLGP